MQLHIIDLIGLNTLYIITYDTYMCIYIIYKNIYTYVYDI
jgi:hypothetical protein